MHKQAQEMLNELVDITIAQAEKAGLTVERFPIKNGDMTAVKLTADPEDEKQKNAAKTFVAQMSRIEGMAKLFELGDTPEACMEAFGKAAIGFTELVKPILMAAKASGDKDKEMATDVVARATLKALLALVGLLPREVFQQAAAIIEENGDQIQDNPKIIDNLGAILTAMRPAKGTA